MFLTRFELEVTDQLLHDWGIEPAHRIIISTLLATADVPLQKQAVQVPLRPLFVSLGELGLGQDDAKKAIQEMMRPRSILHSSMALTFPIVDEVSYIERPQEISFVINPSFARVVGEMGELLSQHVPTGSRVKYLH